MHKGWRKAAAAVALVIGLLTLVDECSDDAIVTAAPQSASASVTVSPLSAGRYGQ